MGFQVLEPVKDKALIDKAKKLRASIVEDVCKINPQWIKKMKLDAVLREMHGPFSSDDELKIYASVLQSFQIEECFAISLTMDNIEDFLFRIPTTLEGLIDFRRECNAFYYILISLDLRFVLLITCDDYHILAGVKELVIKMLGKDISEARNDFVRYINKLKKRGFHKWAQFLQSLYDIYL